MGASSAEAHGVDGGCRRSGGDVRMHGNIVSRFFRCVKILSDIIFDVIILVCAILFDVVKYYLPLNWMLSAIIIYYYSQFYLMVEKNYNFFIGETILKNSARNRPLNSHHFIWGIFSVLQEQYFSREVHICPTGV